MKIIRFISKDKKFSYGAFNETIPKLVKLIEGNIFHSFTITDKEAAVVKMLAPILPVNIIALCINHKKHGEETAMAYLDQPVLFLKAVTSITENQGPVAIPQLVRIRLTMKRNWPSSAAEKQKTLISIMPWIILWVILCK
jgi:2-keto-4-pentenoate hydratase/2-oxohepta-3-ene-1,7-dioic acid hydratase in catechol pathway